MKIFQPGEFNFWPDCEEFLLVVKGGLRRIKWGIKREALVTENDGKSPSWGNPIISAVSLITSLCST
jgi:hypothetical protein